jgi:DNA-binding transcriptional MerR regulator
MRTPSPYYTITEVSEKIGEPPHVIRFWEEAFGLRIRRHANSGNRMFQHKDLVKLDRIRYLLREELFTIGGAKRNMASRVPPQSNESTRQARGF